MTDDFGSGMGTTAEEEFDFSGDGLPEGDKLFTITDLEVEEKGNGKQVVLTFETPEVDWPIKVGYWTEHSNPKAEKAGRGQLKRIGEAAIGQPKYTRATIVGSKVLAKLKDREGFADLSQFRKAPAAVPAVAL